MSPRGAHRSRRLRSRSWLGAVAAPALAQAAERSAAELMDAVMWNREPIGGPFALTDHNGKPRTDADFRGKLMLVYFGFTYCPDICPTDLQSIGLALDQLGRGGRCRAAALHHARSRARHGRASRRLCAAISSTLDRADRRCDAIRKAADAYKVYYAKVPTADRSDYTVDHSAFIYLMDRDGRYLGFFPPGTPPDRMAEVIRPLVEGAHRP